MARPRAEDPRAVLGVRVPASLLGEVDGAAGEVGVTRSAYVERALRSSLNGRPASDPAPVSDEPAEDTPEREAWVRRRVTQLRAKGMTTPLALREAEREWGRR